VAYELSSNRYTGNREINGLQLNEVAVINLPREFKSLRAVRLETDIALLKKEEERFRYLVTSTSSNEYRREATAKLEDTRRKIHLAQVELKQIVG
jgi:hypothetical protein